MKIIIADDQPDIRDMVKLVLGKKGFEVIGDPTGELISNLSGDLPDLIILDINMGRRDGGDLCTKLKEQSWTKDIPVILISGILDLPLISQYVQAEGYLVKPFQMADLEEKIAQVSA